ncbi:hypothetical protein L1987_34377 [Smallanthus sonchifolius]|uniref:Uncharacterized protein n=1 Tax=Smallanthus sonchifolius TaxID=185202 RepID=A0ACB9HTC8_9ASTR|nr:hypothetical protein L1987_34377 [Smallanthus sonchifolius]
MGQQLENTKPLDSSPAPSVPWRWDSPLIYLFGGIGLMFVLIMVALLMLACSHRSLTSEATDGDDVIDGDHFQKAADLHVCKGGDEAILSPKIAVIMAGDELPTYLAAPAHVPNSITINLSGCSCSV